MKWKNTYYQEFGPKNTRPVVFIHAFPLDHTMWSSQIEMLSQNYRVIAYDIRGLGQSEAEDGQYTLEFLVDDLLELLDFLKLEQITLCGLSMGGYIALRAVEKMPEKFGRLILCDTRSEADANEAKLKRAAAIKTVKEKGVAFFADEFLKGAIAPETHQQHPEVVRQIKEMILKNSPTGIVGALIALVSRTDTTASLEKIKVPTLILVGEKDGITPLAASQSLNKKIPNSKLQVIPNAGHLSNLENPSEFNRRLVEWLA